MKVIRVIFYVLILAMVGAFLYLYLTAEPEIPDHSHEEATTEIAELKTDIDYLLGELEAIQADYDALIEEITDRQERARELLEESE